MDREKGQSHFKTRSRIMLLLGQQLITDEVAAISELIKNAYDADATKLQIQLNNVSSDQGEIVITDNGNGMTRQTLLNSWLEIGTISKAKKGGEERVSDIFKRPYLGEKGLGRLSIHKLGKKSILTTRKRDSESEVALILDWSIFDDQKKYLDEIKVDWEEGSPEIFVETSKLEFTSGTQIRITSLHRKWTKEMIRKMKQFIVSLKSPFSGLSNFEINIDVNDPLDFIVKADDLNTVLKTAHYTFTADVDEKGFADIDYEYHSKLYQNFARVAPKERKNLKNDSEIFQEGRNPICGPFKFQIYCWDLDPKDKKATFDENITYEISVKPLTGIKLFRDGFRVLPYGNEDNDWLNMDKARIGRFQENVSRSQVIGLVEISTKKNPHLEDKSDREGLMDNNEFVDFKALVLAALNDFQIERNKERVKIKALKKEDVRVRNLSKQFSDLLKILEEHKISKEVREIVSQYTTQINTNFNKILEDAEEPLIAAASIGLTYMIPTHEAERSINESQKILGEIIKGGMTNPHAKIKLVIEQLKQTDEILKGIVKISQSVKDEERFNIKIPVEFAINLMRPNIKRNLIEIVTDYKLNKTIVGSQRLISILLLNLLDNCIYWLNSVKKQERKIKISIVNYDKDFDAIIVSDTGPGIHDDLEVLTQPFVTRKPKGMGLGLYICDRIAKMHNGKIKLLAEFDIPGLLSGANVALLIPRVS